MLLNRYLAHFIVLSSSPTPDSHHCPFLSIANPKLQQQWNERYEWISHRNDEYFLLCITDSTGKVVGTGALIVERKFIHQLGLVGHIEDIAVAKDQQGKKLGLRIIQALDYVAEKVGCYKVCVCMIFFAYDSIRSRNKRERHS